MRILFATQEYFPDRGGLQTSTEKLIHWLTFKGHSCALLVFAKRRDLLSMTGLYKAICWKFFKRSLLISDQGYQYPVYRTKTPFESLRIVKKAFQPDVLVCVVGGSHTIDFSRTVIFSAGNFPTVVYLFDIEGVTITTDTMPAHCHVVVNAEVIASLVGRHRTQPPIVPCIVDSGECKVQSTRQTILYINPHPRKGEKLAWEIAEKAHGLKFVFQESWRLSEERRTEILRRAKKLGNVEFRTVTDRPSTIYRDARVLLAPYGPERPRVVDEAQANGIPVVASDVAGLNESVGPGGILLDPSGSIDSWVSALGRLYRDDEYYNTLVAAALENSKRPELQPEYLVEIFEHELESAIERSGLFNRTVGKQTATRRR